MNRIRDYLHRRRTGLSLSDVIYRLIAAYLAFLLFFLIRSEASFTDFSFFMEIPFVLLIAGVILLSALFLLIPGHFWVSMLIFAEGLTYCLFALRQQNTSYFLYGCIALLAFFIFYSDITELSFHFPSWLLWVLSFALFLLIAASVGIYMILRFEDNRGSCFDLGIFTQMYHYMKETGLPFTTCERDQLLSHFAVHISPVFYLLLPFYKLFPHFSTILAGHVLFTYSGMLPLTLICRKHKVSSAAAFAFNVCYALAPAFAGGYDYFIHENCFLPPLILWLFFFLELEKDSSAGLLLRITEKVLCLFSAALLLSVKEDAAIYVCCITLFFLVGIFSEVLKDRQWKKLLCTPALWIFLLSVLYFIVAVKILSSASSTQVSIRYSNYIYDGSNRLSVMLSGILKNPFYVLTQILSAEKLELLACLFLALGFLPLLSGKISGWILLIPLLLFNLMSDYGYQSNIHFQYIYGSSAFLLYLSVINYEALDPKLRRKFLLTAVSGSVLIFGYLFGGNAGYYKSWLANADYRAACAEAQSLVPEDASVAASTFLVPTWSDRDTIYELETTTHMAEYYVLDLRGGSDADAAYSASSDFEEIYRKENAIAVYQYLGSDEYVRGSKKEFSDMVHSLKDTLAAEIEDQLTSGVSALSDTLQISGITFTRVYADQGWYGPSAAGISEGVYMTDNTGCLVYMSYRNDTGCATWSGPSPDADWTESMGGWNNGQGYGWTGDVTE